MNLYLATAENPQHGAVLHKIGYPYRLASYFKFINSKEAPTRMLEEAADGSEWIMDSGLFSLLFGAEKGTLTTYEDFKGYASRYVETMLRWGWKHGIVECDTQSILGCDETDRLREEVFAKCGLEVIYVWHRPDGLARLKSYYLQKTRIALSVPELRIAVSGSKAGGFGDALRVKGNLIALLRECWNRGPRVHLLGCTDAKLLSLRADTADSSSWIYVVSFGQASIFEDGKVKQISDKSPKWHRWMAWAREHYGPDKLEGLTERQVALAASALAFEMAGEQTVGRDVAKERFYDDETRNQG